MGENVTKIKSIVKFRNQIVAVFDENGEQIPEYQGWVGDVVDKLKPYLNDTQLMDLKHRDTVEIEV